MNITILDNREIIIKTSDTFGTQNENKATVFNFSFPESLINANKKIVFITDDGVYWDLITNNSYKITNAVTKYKTVSAYVWLVDIEKDIDFRSKSWKITFNKNEEPDDVVPTEEEISGFDTMIAQLNTAIAEVDNIDIDAEKVGDTATVTITNKQGTQKSVEIKDGSDYVITEDDYRKIANIVEADLPENYYNKTETNNLLDGKVDKETGKSLIETSKIEKLDGIETGAEVNVIEDVKVNGTSLEVEEKAVNIPVPTDLKDLTDDSTHRLVSDSEKTTWNNKADISDIPDVSGFITKDVNNLTNYTLKTNTGSLIDLEINQSTYVVTLTLKDIDGNVISTDNIDLPLESVVVGGSYDATNKKIVLTLENGNTVDIPVGDLIAGLQTEITSQNKLASDLVDDSNSGNKFVNTSEKNSWNAKYDKPAGGIPKTDLTSAVQTSLDKADTAVQDVSDKEDISNKVTEIDENSTDTEYPSAKLLYDELAEKQEQIDGLVTENALLKDQIPNGTAEGTNVQITDSSNLPIEDGVIKGNTSQESTTGKNLVPNNLASGSSSGITYTVNSDGSIKLSGTATARVEPNLYFDINNPITFKAGTYRNTSSKVIILYANGYILTYPNQTFTLDEDKNVIQIYFRIENGETVNETYYPQIILNSITDTTYEPYTGGQPSPNPDFPQTIHTVTGDCNVKVQNKNWFDIESIMDLSAYIGNVGETISVSVNSNVFRLPILKSNKDKLIISSRKTSCIYRIRLLDSNNKILSSTVYTSTPQIINTSDCEYIAIMFDNTTISKNDNIQIEESTAVTDYVEHEEQNITLPLPTGMEVCKIGDYQDKIFKNTKNSTMYKSSLIEGAWYKYSAIGKVVLDGSEAWGTIWNDSEKNLHAWVVSISDSIIYPDNLEVINPILCDNFKTYGQAPLYNNQGAGKSGIAGRRNTNHIFIENNDITTLTDFKTWLGIHNTTVYYVLATPTYTKITDTTLIAQLEAYYNSSTYRNVTNIITTGDDLAPIASIVYKKDLTTLFNKLDSLEARVDLLE